MSRFIILGILMGSMVLVTESYQKGLASSLDNLKKTQLTVYYDSLCPYSKRFIKNLLHPVMTSPIGKLVHLKMLPYGTASTVQTSSGEMVKCTHGDRECYLDKIHACALHMFKKELALSYIDCISKAGWDIKVPEETCAKNNTLEFELIEDCANGKSGTKFLLENGVKTNSIEPPLTQVPWVVFDGVYSSEKMYMALTNLKAAICKEVGEHTCNEAANLQLEESD